MQQRFKLPVLVGLCALAYGLPGWAADLPIGVVEPQKVLDGSKVGRKIKDALADYVNTRQRLIESEEQDIKAMEADLVKQGADLSPEAKQEKEAVIRQKLLAYRKHVQELEGEVQTRNVSCSATSPKRSNRWCGRSPREKISRWSWRKGMPDSAR